MSAPEKTGNRAESWEVVATAPCSHLLSDGKTVRTIPEGHVAGVWPRRWIAEKHAAKNNASKAFRAAKWVVKERRDVERSEASA
jgi:hypothetical protein